METTTLNVHQDGVLKARLIVEADGQVRVQGDSSLIDLHATPQGTSIETDPHAWARAMALTIEGASVEMPAPEPVAAPEPVEVDNSRLAQATSRARQRVAKEKASRVSRLEDKTSLMGPRRLIPALSLPGRDKEKAVSLPGSADSLPWFWLLGAAPVLGLAVVVGARFVNLSETLAMVAGAALGCLLALDKLKGRDSKQQLMGVLIAAGATLAVAYLATRNPAAVSLIDRITGR